MKALLAALAFCCLIAAAAAQTPSSLNSVIQNAPAASSPLTGNELIGIVQNGLFRKMTASQISTTVPSLLSQLTVTPSSGLNFGLTINQAGSGTNTTTSTCDPAIAGGFAFNCLHISADTSGAAGVNSLLVLNYDFGGNADLATCTPFPTQCSHTPLWINMTQTLPTVGVAFNTGLFVNNTVTSAAPGYMVGGTVKVQSVFGLGVQISDDGGKHYGVTGGEVDIALTKNDTLRKMGWEVASAPLAFGNDAFMGTLFSAAYTAFSGACGTGSGPGGGGCAGFTYGFSFGRDDAYVPVPSTGTLMVVTPGIGTANFANGVDFSAATFSDSAFKSSGFNVNGRGEVRTSAAAPAFFMNDTSSTPTTGGLVRIGASGGSVFFQINTAVAADFSSSTTAIAWTATGSVVLPSLPTSAGGGGLYVCVDTAGVLYKKAACP